MRKREQTRETSFWDFYFFVFFREEKKMDESTLWHGQKKLFKRRLKKFLVEQKLILSQLKLLGNWRWCDGDVQRQHKRAGGGGNRSSSVDKTRNRKKSCVPDPMYPFVSDPSYPSQLWYLNWKCRVLCERVFRAALFWKTIEKEEGSVNALQKNRTLKLDCKLIQWVSGI